MHGFKTILYLLGETLLHLIHLLCVIVLCVSNSCSSINGIASASPTTGRQHHKYIHGYLGLYRKPYVHHAYIIYRIWEKDL